MRACTVSFLVAIMLFLNQQLLFAQSHAVHEIDSVMDLSPDYLPTSFSYNQSINFNYLTFIPVDTGMTTTHLFDPLFHTKNIFQNLGICGQAHQSMIFNYQREMGFLYQTLPYSLFFKKQPDLTFYKLSTTYSKIAYSFGFPKENEIFATFAKYMKGVTVSANLYAISNEGAFTSQNSSNLCGDILVHYELPSSIYGFRASYIINHLKNLENGGLIDIKLYQDTSMNVKNFQIQTPNAYSTITTHDFSLQNYVNIKNKNNRYFGTVTYDFQLGKTTLIYNDIIDTSSSRYENYYYSTIATNDSTKIMNVKNAIQWSNYSPYKEKETQRNFFHVAGGLLHDYANIQNLYTSFTSLYAFARTHIHLFDVMDITGSFSYSFWSDYSNNDMAATAGISFSINKEKEHAIGFNASYYRNDPEYFMQHVTVNNFRWANQFLKQNFLQIQTFWNYKTYNVSASYYRVSNLVYLSEELRPVQSENIGNLVQLSTFVPYRYKNFGATANLNFQYCSKEVVKVPLFAGKLSLYYIFEFLQKRLKILIGTDLMYNTAYYADAYLPVLHKFYNQDSQLTGNFIYWDANVTFRIDRINFFFRVSNLLPAIQHNRNISTPNYPSKANMINLGISWRFYD
ncbi:MAG: putative porin [Lentimicrobiaceae bacterium]|nr:putative porin [Lentimicrobiaceae bacterium]